MLHITLGPGRPGDVETMSETELYEAGRRAWVLGARADQQSHALISYRGTVRQAIEIDHLEDEKDGGGRRAIVGRVLHAGDPVHDTWVGKPSPVTRARNPITYVDAEAGQRLCRCGCETLLTGPGLFVPGHDQRAVHARVAQVGTVAEFLDWFDATYPATAATR